MLEQDEYSFCRPHLINGEFIRWKGKPAEGNLFTSHDVYMIPLSIFWCGFAIFWETSVVVNGAPFFFWLFGAVFVCVGLYLVFGRFFWTAWIRKRTRYVITNMKIIRLRGNRVDMMDGKNMPHMRTYVYRNGNGTIQFGAVPHYYRGSVNLVGSSWTGNEVFQLENVAELAQVQQAIASMER
jgi:hypothetical protein